MSGNVAMSNNECPKDLKSHFCMHAAKRVLKYLDPELKYRPLILFREIYQNGFCFKLCQCTTYFYFARLHVCILVK